MSSFDIDIFVVCKGANGRTVTCAYDDVPSRARLYTYVLRSKKILIFKYVYIIIYIYIFVRDNCLIFHVEIMANREIMYF